MDDPRILHFSREKAAREQRVASRTADQGSSLRQITERNAELQRDIAVAQIWLILLSDQIDRWREDLKRTAEFCQACQEACDLTDVTAMEQVRDRLTAELKNRLKKSTPYEEPDTES